MNLETIPLAKVNRLYLIKHHLFRRAKNSQLTEVVRDVCGLQAQSPVTPYLSLWNRVENFETRQLDSALYNDKTLVKMWLMRGTLHIVPSEDLPVYNKALSRMWLERHEPRDHAPGWPSMTERRELVYPTILEALAEKPLKRNELNVKVRLLLKDDSKPYESFFSAWGGILKEMSYQGLTVHARPCGKESCFTRLDGWLPNINLGGIDEAKAKEKLVLKYLRGYGPAQTQDFCCWSGLTATDARDAIANASTLLAEVKIANTRGRFWMQKEDFKTLDSMDLDEKPPVILLPKFDSALLGHMDRTRIIRLEHKKYVFKPKVGDIAATVLVDGCVVGTWRQNQTKHMLRITVRPFEKIGKSGSRGIEDKAKELGEFAGADEVRLAMTGQGLAEIT